MGIAQAGIAFRISTSVDDLEGFMGSVFDERATEIPLPVSVRFDIRNHSDVMVQTFGEVCFISNDDLAWPLIRNSERDIGRLHAALGSPDLMMAFCHYDSGGSHGYAIFEDGRRTRTRLQTSGQPDMPALVESGTPLAFEQRWLGARHYVDAATTGGDDGRMVFLGEREVVVPARDLTGRMLQDGLDALFGVCPWETLLTPTYRFFRLGPERERAGEPAISRARAIPAIKRPWWQFL
ncbi:hypothetical protein [Scleromatobacter humisilvae]|uniref:Uncharacterized protein n=1 Tax=Scleromatobacter humisilvae TaxID=2897159 RepID=A0A9X1YFX9_9BURK|nr:hypothetical protein [Scleromatobacter humisilvae]MCK9684957.1 hypothetical protein [Scleromatobacter humisilvae]